MIAVLCVGARAPFACVLGRWHPDVIEKLVKGTQREIAFTIDCTIQRRLRAVAALFVCGEVVNSQVQLRPVACVPRSLG